MQRWRKKQIPIKRALKELLKTGSVEENEETDGLGQEFGGARLSNFDNEEDWTQIMLACRVY